MFKRVGYSSLSYFDRSSDTIFKYAFLDKYVSIIEPSADMEIKLYDAYRTSKNTFKYKICPSAASPKNECQYGSRYYNSTTSSASSTSVNFDCSPHEKFSVTVTEFSYDSGEILSTFEGSAICLYVRRELRSLPANDLTALTDAMEKLWFTTDTEGAVKYGQGFHNITYLLKFHHFNAADRKTDHIHNGNGIILQHIKFTNIFEGV